MSGLSTTELILSVRLYFVMKDNFQDNTVADMAPLLKGCRILVRNAHGKNLVTWRKIVARIQGTSAGT